MDQPNHQNPNPAPPVSDSHHQGPAQQPHGMPGAQGFPQPNGYQPKQTNVMAIIALVVTFIMPVVGLVLGVIALSQIKKTGEDGRILAIIAIVINAIQVVIFIVVISLLVIFADEISEFEAEQESNFSTLDEAADEVSASDEPSAFERQRVAARDTERQVDIQAIRGQLEAYGAEFGYYPPEVDLLLFPGLDPDALEGPQGETYNYTPAPDGCTECSSWVLSAELEDGTTYTEESLL